MTHVCVYLKLDAEPVSFTRHRGEPRTYEDLQRHTACACNRKWVQEWESRSTASWL